MSTMRSAFRMSASLAIAAIAALSGSAFAADPVTKDEAMAMVKEAVAAIKSEGPEKAYAEITIRRASSSTAIFTSWSMASTAWFSRTAPTNRASAPTRSTTRIPTARPSSKSASTSPSKNPSFWQSYKFMNPVTKKVEPKQMYCERLDETAVCGGIYQN